VNSPTWLIAVAGSGEFLDVHVQDFHEAHQDAVAVDAALAALDLGQVPRSSRSAHRWSGVLGQLSRNHISPRARRALCQFESNR
jgi:hypothetical protein